MKRVWQSSAVVALLLTGGGARADEAAPTRLECRVVDGPNPAQRGSVLMLTMVTQPPALRLTPPPVLDSSSPASAERVVDPMPPAIVDPFASLAEPLPAFDPNALVDPFQTIGQARSALPK